MMTTAGDTGSIQPTGHRTVLPFYAYAAVSFLVATILLASSSGAFTLHYFHPHILAITHTAALGWGTMIVLGASHQLVPVLTGGKLFSDRLAMLSFFLAATGIPLLVYAFYVFNTGLPMRTGGILINLAVVAFLVNTGVSISKSRNSNVHGIFIFTSACWLLCTTSAGLMLAYNFSYPLLPQDSLRYLPLHAHMGIVGWFMMVVVGTGTRLIPMFLISKYTNDRLLWSIYLLINLSLIAIVVSFLFPGVSFFKIPAAGMATAMALFGYYCYQAYRQRLRRQVDEQVKLSMLSILIAVVPFAIMALIMNWTAAKERLTLAYGFTIFFGWITSIILGMTFKTLPFIVWNKVYHDKAGLGKTPNPKDLFSSRLFLIMSFIYLAGFLLFMMGIIMSDMTMLRFGALLLLVTGILYNINVFKTIAHRTVS